MKLIPSNLNTQLTRTVGRAVLKSKVNSPHIFFVGGVVGVVAGTVLACRATLKLEPTLDEISEEIKKVKQTNPNNPVNPPSDRVDDERTYYTNLGVASVKGLVKVGKLYGPAIVIGGISIAALTGSHIQLTRRNSALTATLAATMKAFDEYRARVREEVGEEREIELYHCLEDCELEEDGKKKTVKAVSKSNLRSPYAKIYDDFSPHWRKDAEENRIFLHLQQDYWNKKLVSRGHVFLNEVYDSLGFDHTPAGAVVGWLKNNPDGDNYINFNIVESYNNRFVNGIEPCVLLDFNVDGIIQDKI